MQTLVQMLRNVARHHAMIFAMAARDIHNKYIGTLGGALWVFVHPLAVVITFYFVFAVGFRAQGSSGAPFVLWFVCGLIPWFFFSETLMGMTNSITQNTHLVKKTVFPVEVLAFVNLLSGLFGHAVFLLVLCCVLGFYGVPFMPARLLVAYFLICNCVFLVGFGWLLSSLQVFYRDIAQGLAIVLNLCFWTTPIVWSTDIVPAEYRWILDYNPIYYIVEGYRGLLIYKTIEWPTATATFYFWIMSISLFFIGGYVFRRLKQEFADVM